MSTASTQSRYRLVIALDRSTPSELLLQHALDQAVRQDAVDLHFVTVERDDELLADAADWLAATVAEGMDSFGHAGKDWTSRLHVRIGDAAEEIANLAAELEADLLVIGRSSVSDPHGSLADVVVARSECPVLVVHLAEHDAASENACAECVEVRDGSEGERWFCEEHSSEGEPVTSRMPPPTTPANRIW
jgi:nucleotide-binding universal stress UspA family protein